MSRLTEKAPDRTRLAPQATCKLYFAIYGQDGDVLSLDDVAGSPYGRSHADPSQLTGLTPGSMIADAGGGAAWWANASGVPEQGAIAGAAQSFTGLQTFGDGIATDTIAEETADTGVTIDGLKIKDKGIDFSGLATTEPYIAIPFNKADAFSLTDPTGGDWLVIDTRAATANAGWLKRLTTTDGVASGTARIVGGLCFSSTAISTTVTGGSGAQAYSVTHSLPANTLKAGTFVRISAQAIALAQNGTDTFKVELYLGTTLIAATGAVDIAPNDRAVLWAELQVYAAPGGTVAVYYRGTGMWTTAGSGPADMIASVANQATNGALVLSAKVTYGSSNSGNTSALESLVVLAHG